MSYFEKTHRKFKIRVFSLEFRNSNQELTVNACCCSDKNANVPICEV